MSIVIVGAGQAGLQIAESLRRGAYDGRIVLVGDESFPPYQRPPLSKKYLADQMADERLYFRPLEQLEKQQIEFRPQTRVTALDREAHACWWWVVALSVLSWPRRRVPLVKKSPWSKRWIA